MFAAPLQQLFPFWASVCSVSQTQLVLELIVKKYSRQTLSRTICLVTLARIPKYMSQLDDHWIQDMVDETAVRTAMWASAGSLQDTQNLRPRPRPAWPESARSQVVLRTWNFEKHGAGWSLQSLPSHKHSDCEFSFHTPGFRSFPILFSLTCWRKISLCYVEQTLCAVNSPVSARGFLCCGESGLRGLNANTAVGQLPSCHILKPDKWKMGMVSNLITFVFRFCWEQTLIYELATDTRFPAYVIYIWMGGRMDR